MRRPRRLAKVFEEQKKQFRKLPRGLTLAQIMHQVGIDYFTAYRWCQRYDYTPKLHHGVGSEARELRQKQLQRLPPNLTVKQIAKRLKTRTGAVYQWIHQTDYVFRKGYIKVAPERWREVDWTLQDVDIARMLKVSRELVRTKRIRLRKPKSPFQGLRALARKHPQLPPKSPARRRR